MEKVAFIIVVLSLTVVLSYRELRELQLAGYKLSPKRRNTPIWQLVAEALFLLAMLTVVLVVLQYDVTLAYAFATGGMIITSALMWNSEITKRTKLRFTKRATRIFIIALIADVALVCSSIYIHNRNIIPAAALVNALCGRLMTWLAYSVMLPYDSYRNRQYILLAKQRFAEAKGIKIGITGSFGKTSCKNILKEMFSIRYNVFATEGNFNTPMGIARASERLSGEEDILIAEMGARSNGDIKELCDIFVPSVGIVTGVNEQHLQTFGSVQNTYETKRELPGSIPLSGFVVYNADNAHTRKMSKENFGFESIVAGSDEAAEIRAVNIVTTDHGSEFDLIGLDAEPLHFITKLLGAHNIANIAMCAAAAHKLGVSNEELVGVVANIVPVPHRLELIEGNNGIRIIDDSYNSNFEGALIALDVLKSFNGRKVVYEQGLVELGARGKAVNIALGERLAGIADVVILSGINKHHIKIGLLNKGFNPQSIYCFSGFEEARRSLGSILKPGDVFLIQNDLP